MNGIKVVLTSKNYTNQIKQSLTNREHKHKHKEKKVLRHIKRYALQIRLHSKVSDTESGGCLSKNAISLMFDIKTDAILRHIKRYALRSSKIYIHHRSTTSLWW